MINFLSCDTIHFKYKLLWFLLYIKNPRSRDILPELGTQEQGSSEDGLAQQPVPLTNVAASKSSEGGSGAISARSCLHFGQAKGGLQDIFYSTCPRSQGGLPSSVLYFVGMSDCFVSF